jgi:lipopolysaccharide export system protein LptC
LATAYSGDRASGFAAAPRRDTDQLYRAALRHSRLVRALRIGVPGALFSLLIVIVGANYAPTGKLVRLPGELEKLVIRGTKVTMQKPHLTGFTNDLRPYEMGADFAEQDITRPDLMELHKIHGRLEEEDKSMVNITSDAGTYNLKTEMLTLAGNVHMLSTTGNEARLSEATVDVHKGTAVSEKPVWVKLANSVINAKRLELLDNGEVIRFGGGVSMIIQPDHEDARHSTQ